MNEQERLYLDTLQRHEAAAERTRQLIVNRAKRHAQRAGIPTADPMWALYLHNWLITDIRRGKEADLLRRGYTPDQLREAKRARYILDKQWDPSALVRKWANKRSAWNGRNRDYWQRVAKREASR